MSRTDRVPVKVVVTVRELDGSTPAVATLNLAVVARGVGPSSSTSWTSLSYAGSVTTVLAGPDANQSVAVPVPAGGGVLWGQITTNGNPRAFPIEEVRLL